ncbi:hypothetical protein [Methyloprofundus sp.]|uniref:hypothetical protein n=1 Tax=Methyloprofundus sp. TaxID=2020875 RepID=UPI003D0B2A18
MNNIEVHQISGTVSAVIIATAISGLPATNEINQDFSQIITAAASYVSGGSSPTFSESKNLQQNSINHNSINVSFEHSTSQLYSALESQQEPLGKEFEKVLYDNLWELYES